MCTTPQTVAVQPTRGPICSAKHVKCILFLERQASRCCLLLILEVELAMRERLSLAPGAAFAAAAVAAVVAAGTLLAAAAAAATAAAAAAAATAAAGLAAAKMPVAAAAVAGVRAVAAACSLGAAEASPPSAVSAYPNIATAHTTAQLASAVLLPRSGGTLLCLPHAALVAGAAAGSREVPFEVEADYVAGQQQSLEKDSAVHAAAAAERVSPCMVVALAATEVLARGAAVPDVVDGGKYGGAAAAVAPALAAAAAAAHAPAVAAVAAAAASAVAPLAVAASLFAAAAPESAEVEAAVDAAPAVTAAHTLKLWDMVERCVELVLWPFAAGLGAAALAAPVAAYTAAAAAGIGGGGGAAAAAPAHAELEPAVYAVNLMVGQTFGTGVEIVVAHKKALCVWQAPAEAGAQILTLWDVFEGCAELGLWLSAAGLSVAALAAPVAAYTAAAAAALSAASGAAAAAAAVLAASSIHLWQM
eukprot:287229-Chlamydomonas_euryale.AAC.8